MEIVVVGAGDVGFHLAKVLSSKGNSVTVIDKDEQKLAKVDELIDARTIAGFGSSAKDLARAGIGTANVILAVTDMDEVNMLACLTAKHIGHLSAVARVRNPAYLEGTKTFYRNILGIDLIISPEVMSAMDVTNFIREPGAVTVESLADGKVQMKQFNIEKNFKYIGTKLSNLKKLPEESIIALILRGDRMIIPRGDEVINIGDSIYVIGKSPAMSSIEKFFCPKHSRKKLLEKKSVTIVGGGQIGHLVANLLSERKYNIKIIEEDKERCEYLARNLPGVLVLNGDGADFQFLKSEGIENEDYFIAASESDEKNLLSALTSKNLKAKETIVIARKPERRFILRNLGFSKVICPGTLTTKMILKYIDQGNIVSRSIKKPSIAEIMEIDTSESSSVTNKSLSEAGFPQNVLVVSLVRGNEVHVPKGSDRIRPRDTLIILAHPEEVKRIKAMV